MAAVKKRALLGHKRSQNIGVRRTDVRRERGCSDLGQGVECVLDCAAGVRTAISVGRVFVGGCFFMPLPSHSCASSLALHGSWPSKSTLMLSLLNTLQNRNGPLVLKLYKCARLKKYGCLVNTLVFQKC